MSEKQLYLRSSWLSFRTNVFGRKSFPFATILVNKLDEIGDMVTALHVFYMLHKQYPSAIITVYCKPFNNAFFTYLPYINVVNSIEEIPDIRFDLIVELRGSEETLALAKRNKPHYRLDRGSVRLKNKFLGGQKNEIHTNAQIIAPLIRKENYSLVNPVLTSPKEQQKVDELLQTENIDRFCLLHVGSRQAVKKWPIERFAAVISHINAIHNMPCILIGGKEDVEANKACLALVKSKNNFSIAGDFNLLEFAALCSSASLYLGNDSGPLHIAAANKTPIVGLYSNAVKDVWYPLGENVRIHHYFLARNHREQTVENSTIFNISEDEVKESVDFLLQESS